MIQTKGFPTLPTPPSCTLDSIALKTAVNVGNLNPDGIRDLFCKLSLGASGGNRARNIGGSVGEFALFQLNQTPAHASIRVSIQDIPVVVHRRGDRYTARINFDSQSSSWVHSALSPFDTTLASLGVKILFSNTDQTGIDLDYLIHWMFMSGLPLYYDNTNTFAQAVAEEMNHSGINHEIEMANLSSSLFAYFSFEALEGWSLTDGMLRGTPYSGRQGAVGIHFHRPDFGALITERADATTARNALLRTLGDTTSKFHSVCDHAYD